MTPKIARTNWNRDFQWLMVLELNAGWKMLEEEIGDTMGAIFEAINLRLKSPTISLSSKCGNGCCGLRFQ